MLLTKNQLDAEKRKQKKGSKCSLFWRNFDLYVIKLIFLFQSFEVTEFTAEPTVILSYL